jgi:pseudaminic acid synthase
MRIKIGSREIGDGRSAFVIAELSGNHHQKYEEAEKLVREAAKAGADAVKLQTYTADTLTLNSRKKWFVVGGVDQPDNWKGQTLYDLYKTAYTPWEWQPKLKRLADELGIALFSSVFDDTSVDFMEREVNPPCYKIASYEAIHVPLLKKVAGTGKPVIISIGFTELPDVELAIETLRAHGSGEIIVLHCVTEYADKASYGAMNLRTIADIRERFGALSGFSDNNGGIVVPTAAVALGACAVEKHLTLGHAAGGPDDRFSITPSELSNMVQNIRKIEKDPLALKLLVSEKNTQAMEGRPCYGCASSKERENTIFRPSIFVKKEVKVGEPFTLDNIRVCRPKYGLPPKHFEEVLGRAAAMDIDEATPLSWDMVV